MSGSSRSKTPQVGSHEPGSEDPEWQTQLVSFQNDFEFLWPVPHSGISTEYKSYDSLFTAIQQQLDKCTSCADRLQAWVQAFSLARDKTPLPHQRSGQSTEHKSISSLWAMIGIFHNAAETVKRLDALSLSNGEPHEAYRKLFDVKSQKYHSISEFFEAVSIQVPNDQKSSLHLAKTIMDEHRPYTSELKRISASLAVYDGSLQFDKTSSRFFVRVVSIECIPSSGMPAVWSPIGLTYFPPCGESATPRLDICLLSKSLFSLRQKPSLDQYECHPGDKRPKPQQLPSLVPVCTFPSDLRPRPMEGIMSFILQNAIADQFSPHPEETAIWSSFLPNTCFPEMIEARWRPCSIDLTSIKGWISEAPKHFVDILIPPGSTEIELDRPNCTEKSAALGSLLSWIWMKFLAEHENLDQLLPPLRGPLSRAGLNILEEVQKWSSHVPQLVHHNMVNVLRRAIWRQSQNHGNPDHPDDVLAAWASFVSRNLLRKNDLTSMAYKTWIDRVTRNLVNSLKHRPRINKAHCSIYVSLVVHLQHLLLMATSLAYGMKGQVLTPEEMEILFQVTRLWTLQPRWMYRLLKVLPSRRYPDDEWVLHPVWTCCYGSYEWLPLDSTRFRWKIDSTQIRFPLGPKDVADSLEGCTLYDRELYGIKLSKVELHKCKLWFCELDGCKLTEGTTVTDCLLRDCTRDGSADDIYQADSLSKAKRRQLAKKGLLEFKNRFIAKVQELSSEASQNSSPDSSPSKLPAVTSQQDDPCSGDSLIEVATKAMKQILQINPTLDKLSQTEQHISEVVECIKTIKHPIHTQLEEEIASIEQDIPDAKSAAIQRFLVSHPHIEQQKQLQRELRWIVEWTVDFFSAQWAIF